MSRRFKVDDKVWVELTAKHEEILQDMALVDATGEMLQGVRMQGTIRSVSRKNKSVHFKIYFPAAEEELQFSCAKTNKVSVDKTSVYFVVVTDKSGKGVIKKVTDLELAQDVKGYHKTMRAARQELRELAKSSSSTTTTTISKTTTVNSTNVTTTKSTSATPETATAAAASACNPMPANDSATQVCATVEC